MTKLSLLAAAGLAIAAAAPAAGSMIVLGSSVGYGCYQNAARKVASAAAVADCDSALASGMLSFHDEVATYVNRGVVKLHSDRHDAAIADFDRAIAKDPSQPESYLNKGATLLRMQGDARAAIALFDEALQRGTTKPELAYYSRAIANEVAGDAKAAYLDYRRAAQAAPKWNEPRQQLSRFTVARASANNF